MKYRNVNFEVDLLALDKWRWTILPQKGVGPNTGRSGPGNS
jgi:hypothetical protein